VASSLPNGTLSAPRSLSHNGPREKRARAFGWIVGPHQGQQPCGEAVVGERGGITNPHRTRTHGPAPRLIIGADYLIARTGRTSERPAAEALSEALGGLPLAHEQAAAYCERLDISLANYRKRFEAAPARLLDDGRHAPAEYHDGLTVAKTFALAIEEAAKLDRRAVALWPHRLT
jgi:hypothetical protein